MRSAAHVYTCPGFGPLVRRRGARTQFARAEMDTGVERLPVTVTFHSLASRHGVLDAARPGLVLDACHSNMMALAARFTWRNEARAVWLDVGCSVQTDHGACRTPHSACGATPRHGRDGACVWPVCETLCVPEPKKL